MFKSHARRMSRFQMESFEMLTVFLFRQLWFPRNQSQRQTNFPLWTKPLMTSQFLEDNTSLVCYNLQLHFLTLFWCYLELPQIKLIWSLMVSWNYTPAVMSQNPPADFWRPVRKPSQRRPRPRAPRSRRRRRASASGPAALVLVACGKGMTWRPWTFPRVHGLTLTRSTRGNMVTPWPAQLPMRSLSPWAFRTCELLNKYCLGPNMIYLQVSHFRFFHTCKSVGIGMFQEWGTILFIPSGDMFGTQKGAPCLGTKWHLSQGLGMFRHV